MVFDIWTPEIGVLGTGRMGSRLAAMFARAGKNVVLGSRDPERAGAIVKSLDLPTIRAGTYPHMNWRLLTQQENVEAADADIGA